VAQEPPVSQFVVVSFMGEVVVSPPASLDEVLSAVKETARGRWFLESYEARLRETETSRVLGAIAKLENHIQSMAATSEDAVLVKRAREAISAARRDIAALEPANQALSNEAQLFGKLAERARTAFNDNNGTTQSVGRALQLVGDLERELGAPVATFAPAPAPAVVPAANFFRQDEAIFEPAPKQAPTPAAAPVAESPVEASPRGAKLVVHRAAPRPSTEAVAKAETAAAAPAPAPLPVPEPTELAATPEDSTPKSRIMIVRRKADEMEQVPLMDMADASPTPPASAA
jgi:hypothetical protein